MLFSVRYTKGLGNNILFFRIRNSSNQFYNFTATTWDNSESVQTKIFLAETADTDPYSSLFTCNPVFPSTAVFIKEIVDSTDYSVISNETENQTLNTSISSIETNVNLLLTSMAQLTEFNTGNWEISNNQMIFKNSSNVELMRFNLFDKSGTLSELSVFKRVRV